MAERANGEAHQQLFTRRTMLKGGLALLGGALAGNGLLAACGEPPADTQPTENTGGSTGGAPTATSGGGTGTTPSPQGAGEPIRGGTLTAAAEVDPVSLDPHTNSNFSAMQAFDHLYESLTTYDEEMNIIPALAEEWEISDDGKTYTFSLRPEVKFHNGQTMTADDVKYSIDRVLNPDTASPWRSWLAAIQEITVVDELTVDMQLSDPYPGLLGSFAGMRASAIIPAGLAEEENLKIKAVGTGPFKLVEYVPQDHITYERHTDYWDTDLPYLDGMTFKVLTEENARLAALQAGQIQFTALSAQGADSLKNNGNVTVLQGPYAWVDLTYINVSRPPLDDARVRRALRMSVDTNEIIQKAVFGAGVPAGPVPTGYGEWYLDPESLPYLEPDIEGAKELLAQAGYPDGQGAKVVIKCSPQYPDFVANATVMQESFQKLGVEVEIQQMEWGAFVQDSGNFEYDLANSANTFRPDPDGYIYPYFHSAGNLNAGGYSNPDLDKLIEKARTINDTAERKKLYEEIQRTLLEDSPNFWWYTKFNIEAHSNDVKGYAQSFTGRRLFLKKAWLES